MDVLVVGSGGREHALAWKLASSPQLGELHAAPGNPGIAALGSCHPIRPDDSEGLLELVRTADIELVVIGPEAPLVSGVADELRHAGVSVFGPSAAAARIEGSKRFAKEVMEAAGVPTARTIGDAASAKAPCVVKVDGLAAGKGVFVCSTEEELAAALPQAKAYGEPLLFEELLEGEELSVFAISDGSRVVPLAAARDYKRVGDGDTGPNTGGMGAYSPAEDVDLEALVAAVHEPVVAELALQGKPFTGLLYAGLMITAEGPKVLEFNCRFGDPETQSVLPCLDGDLLPLLAGAASGRLDDAPAPASTGAAVTVVLAGESYPERGDAGSPISGIEEAEADGALVFHAGTARSSGALVTNGGRVLGVTGVGETLADACARAYAGVECISFAGARYRRDVAGA
jgi:phosphoribosylamine--glycine ligase